MYVNHKMNRKQGQQALGEEGGNIMHVCSYIYIYLLAGKGGGMLLTICWCTAL